MSPRLIPRVRPALAALTVSLAVCVALGIAVHGQDHGMAIDESVDGWLARNLPSGIVDAWLHLADPAVVIVVLALCLVVAAAWRRWDLVVVAVIVPVASVLLTEQVGKPLVHRTVTVPANDEYHVLAYPSGHETGIASAIAVAVVVLLSSPLSRRVKTAGLAAIAVVLALATVAIVAGLYHYATDTIGSLALVTAVTLAAALLTDRAHAAIGSSRRKLARQSLR